MIILISFKKCAILKKFDKKLKEDNIEFDKESNDNWYNYRFNMISYYIIYFNLKIQNEEYFIKQYIKHHKNLTEKEKDNIFFEERKRFGK